MRVQHVFFSQQLIYFIAYSDRARRALSYGIHITFIAQVVFVLLACECVVEAQISACMFGLPAVYAQSYRAGSPLCGADCTKSRGVQRRIEQYAIVLIKIRNKKTSNSQYVLDWAFPYDVMIKSALAGYERKTHARPVVQRVLVKTIV